MQDAIAVVVTEVDHGDRGSFGRSLLMRTTGVSRHKSAGDVVNERVGGAISTLQNVFISRNLWTLETKLCLSAKYKRRTYL